MSNNTEEGPVCPILVPQQAVGLSETRLAELKRLAYHSSSLDDLGDAVIELIEEVRRLKKC